MKITNPTIRYSRGLGTVESCLLLIGATLAFIWGMQRLDSGEAGVSEVKVKQTAKEMVKIAEVAKIAGLDLVDETNLDRTIDIIETGRTADNGIFIGQYYGVGTIQPAVKAKLHKYLKIEGKDLAFTEFDGRDIRF